MTVWRLQCRTHGGIFVMPSRRGRKPVRCTNDNQCSRTPAEIVKRATGQGDSQVAIVPSRAAALASKIKNKRIAVQTENSNNLRTTVQKSAAPTFKGTNYAVQAAAKVEVPDVVVTLEKPKLKTKGGIRNLRTTVQKPAEVTVTVNTSLPSAQKAKELLTAKGWEVQGRGWFENEAEGRVSHAEVIATRDDERISMLWVEGNLVDQNYQLWANGQPPAVNGRPKSQLDFDPEDIGDQELIRVLSGQSVTWWNRLGSSKESGVIGERVRVTHTFIGGRADENPGERTITFVDREGGYRSFYVSALVKIG